MPKVKATDQTDTKAFMAKLKAYKAIIDADIAAYGKHIQAVTLEQYGADARLETDVFLDILARGGKRLRGALTMVGYEMCGGKNKNMILQAARAIEMLHAYILIIDDIQDRSQVRRGGPAAHIVLRDYHQQHHLAGDSGHFGVSVALNAAVAGAHAAQMILANTDAPEHLRLNALSIINRTMVITAHGQTSDIMHEAVGNVGMEDIEKVMAWKTSQYSFLNPLHVGMVLAGADCHSTDAITDYATNIGKAYQISDDILDTFGSEGTIDDIRDGKRTILVVYGLENTTGGDNTFLRRMLGNQAINAQEFERCKDILVNCGALKYAQKLGKQYIEQAISALDAEASQWTLDSSQFLHGMAGYILSRTL
ncbi:MAG TPA: polyprenyl synthetase family protein [Candidatus Limnocylindrales bacterium]|nr:polyprenyl synthetase family protein [Candidatus Limnocylindrales bacterium]